MISGGYASYPIISKEFTQKNNNFIFVLKVELESFSVHDRFWSQVIFDPSSMNSIKSFLHLAPLQQLYFKIDDQEVLSMYKRIKNAVFQFMKRLLRTKESDVSIIVFSVHCLSIAHVS